MKTLQATILAVVLAIGFSTAAPAYANWFADQAAKVKKAFKDTGSKFKQTFDAVSDALSKKDKKDKKEKKDSDGGGKANQSLSQYVPNLQAVLRTANACDTVFNQLGAKVDASYKMKGMWYPATCGVEFDRGLTCGFVKSIANVQSVLQEAATAAEASALCLPLGKSSINAGTAVPALLCGLAIVQAQRIAAMPACINSLADLLRTQDDKLAQIFTKAGCSVAGDIASGIMVSGGGGPLEGLNIIITGLDKAMSVASTISAVATKVEQELRGSQSVCR